MNPGKQVCFPGRNPHLINQFMAFPPVQGDTHALLPLVWQSNHAAQLWAAVGHTSRVASKT